MKRRMIPYREAIAWLVHNDDTEWLSDNEPQSASVTAYLVADIYDRDITEVTADLRRTIRREREGQ